MSGINGPRRSSIGADCTLKNRNNPLERAFANARATLWGAALFSGMVNILMLTGPIFMLQVYDRVLSSRSVPTLIVLFALVAVLYAFLGFFEFVRARALSRVGYRIDSEVMNGAKEAWITAGYRTEPINSQPVNDLSTIRQFLCSPGLPSLFDLPWAPLYLGIVYLLHPLLGFAAAIGAVLVVLATAFNEWRTNAPLKQAAEWEMRESRFLDGSKRYAEAAISMGMVGNITRHWSHLRMGALALTQKAGHTNEAMSAFSRFVRLLVQSGILALGAYLAILQVVTPGVMIAASILAGRALAPIDMAIGNWKNFLRARQARSRLNDVFSKRPSQTEHVELPPPTGHLSVKRMVKLVPTKSGERIPVLQNINFELQSGDALGVIGQSGSGKSTLARLLVGLTMPDRGAVRLDGARFDQWEQDAIGRHIGYLPQSPGLMSGTVSQNIARFDPDVTDEDVVSAANLAGIHDMILGLSAGYETELLSGGFPLSGGQIQRIALARAVLCKPALVVLDEPNANLDAEGDAALSVAIKELRDAGSTVVVIAHRPSAIAAVNKALMLKGGEQVAFGPRDEVLQKVTQQMTANTAQPPSPNGSVTPTGTAYAVSGRMGSITTNPNRRNPNGGA